MAKTSICAVCGNGLGSSMIIEMAINDVVKELNIDAEVTHRSLNSFSPMEGFDLVLCGEDLSDQIPSGSYLKIPLKNIMDKNEIKTKIEQFLSER